MIVDRKMLQWLPGKLWLRLPAVDWGKTRKLHKKWHKIWLQTARLIVIAGEQKRELTDGILIKIEVNSIQNSVKVENINKKSYLYKRKYKTNCRKLGDVKIWVIPKPTFFFMTCYNFQPRQKISKNQFHPQNYYLNISSIFYNLLIKISNLTISSWNSSSHSEIISLSSLVSTDGLLKSQISSFSSFTSFNSRNFPHQSVIKALHSHCTSISHEDFCKRIEIIFTATNSVWWKSAVCGR